MRSDELNIVNTEQVVEKRNILPIDDFFDEMYLAKSEKEERKDLARNIFIILSAILTIVRTNEKLGNSHDIDSYKEYVSNNLEIVFRDTFGSEKYNSMIESFANDFIEVTIDHIDTDYYTSDDRAIVNAENQSNAIYNKEQHEQAVQSGKTRKMWVTMHDQRVRKTHIEADGQEVDIDKPFLVGGYEMMFPVDKSLGAHSKECINCRCSCIYK